uniref:EB domain-containing protein n=1 Tax=Rhipicephalus zambeziensis TaxID=60191 RepID=A0A224Z1D7_9ACAR
MLRLALLACLCLQQLPTSNADEVVLVSQAPSAAAADKNFNGTLSAEMLAAAALAGVNITIINGTAYEEYEVPDSAPPTGSGKEDSLAAMPAQQPALPGEEHAVPQPSTVAAVETAKEQPEKTPETAKEAPTVVAPANEASSAAPLVKSDNVDTTTTTAATTTSTTTLSTTPKAEVTTPSVETTITTSSGPATVRVELGRLSVYPVPAVVENSGGVELFCSAGYHDSASIVWTLNDEPLEDVVQRSVISGRKDFFLKSLRIQVDRLETLPAPAGKYVFECVASVDGNLLKERVEIDSPYGDFCRNDSECASRNAVCGSSLACRCDGGHPVHLNSSHVTCRAAAHLGWPCSYDEQCTYAANNSQCGSKGECDCVETFKMETSPLGNLACVPRKTVSGPCNTDNDCKDIGAKCNPSGTCQCPQGTLENNGRCVGKLAVPQGQNNLTALTNATGMPTGTNATSVTAETGAMSSAVNTSVASDPKKQHVPVRILKVREFPRGAPVKEHPNDTMDSRAQGLDGGVVKVDVPLHENDTSLGSQRMLTAGGCKCRHSAVLLLAATLAFAASFMSPF